MNPFLRQPASAVQDTWLEMGHMSQAFGNTVGSISGLWVISTWIEMAAVIHKLSMHRNGSLSVRVDLPHSISKDRAKNLGFKDVPMTCSNTFNSTGKVCMAQITCKKVVT